MGGLLTILVIIVLVIIIYIGYKAIKKSNMASKEKFLMENPELSKKSIREALEIKPKPDVIIVITDGYNWMVEPFRNPEELCSKRIADGKLFLDQVFMGSALEG